MDSNKITIELDDGWKLIADRNTDPNYDREMFIYVADPDGCIYQDLVIVRNSYKYNDDDYKPEWINKQFDVLVFADPDNEDFTNDFTIGISDYGQY